MKLQPKRRKIPLSTALSAESTAVLNGLCEAYGSSKVEVLEQLLIQYGRRALKRKEKDQ